MKITEYIRKRETRHGQVAAALFAGAHHRHGQLRSTYTRGLSCSCGASETAGSGPSGMSLIPDRQPVYLAEELFGALGIKAEGV